MSTSGAVMSPSTATTLPKTDPEAVDRRARMFPTLSAAQIARIAAHGTVRPTTSGEVLFEHGEQTPHFFVVTAGEVEVVQTDGITEDVLTVHRAGQFTGELHGLSGRRSLARGRVREAGQVVELDRESLRSLVQTDGELSEILMRAFILRRTSLIAHGRGDVVLLGSSHSAGTLRVKEFLARNGHPYTYIDL